MNKIGARRLLKVAIALDDAAKDKLATRTFTMEKWGRSFTDFVECLRPGESFVYTKGCGTPACAMGHYAVRNDLQRAFRIDGDGDLALNDENFDMYDTRRNVTADTNHLSSHFHITDADVNWLFGNQGCDHAKTPKQAAKFIRRFVKDRT